MRSRVILFATILTTGSLALPLVAYAGIPFFGPIIPPEISRCPAGWGMVMTVINNIISFALTIVIVFIAPLMVAWAGALMVFSPTKVGDINKAKGILQNTVIGIVVALAAWLIVDAVMAVLYNPSTFNSTWYSLIISDASKPCLPVAGSLNIAPNGGLIIGSSATGTVAVVPPSTAPASEAAIRQQLASAGVSVNHPACNPYDLNGVTNGCTNVGGMLQSTVSQVIGIKQACGCDVVVTGGSEAGHAPGTYSHGTGYKVDLRTTTALDSFIQSMNPPSIGTRTGDAPGPAYTDKCGQNQYVKESTHWDITIRSACVPPK